MTIKEFARLCNCNPQTLRYYDRMDLLKPVKVDPYSGYRYYNEEQAIQYVKIKNLQLAGFSIEEIMVAHGTVVQDIDLPYFQQTVTVHKDSDAIAWESHRKVNKYKDLYYRIDKVCFDKKPFIVAELGTYDELMKNIMEDADPFPWDLSEEELEDEVLFFLGERPHPTKWHQILIREDL